MSEQLHTAQRKLRPEDRDLHVRDGVQRGGLLPRAQEALQRVLGRRLRALSPRHLHHFHLHDQLVAVQGPARLHLRHHHRRHRRRRHQDHGRGQQPSHFHPRQFHFPVLPPPHPVRERLLPQQEFFLPQFPHHPGFRGIWDHHFGHGSGIWHFLARTARVGLRAFAAQFDRVRGPPRLHRPCRHPRYLPGSQGGRNAVHAGLRRVGDQRRGSNRALRVCTEPVLHQPGAPLYGSLPSPVFDHVHGLRAHRRLLFPLRLPHLQAPPSP
mmetsp:Transcript_32946/g.78534  ORF Transcript_32946/g.78534 Transcript_32946/m.78534 type:complete len:267 (-) Transcript_32946:955-1755(-)